MADVVQSRCPHCQNMLRIPAKWLDQPIKCKHCGQVFQTRSRSRRRKKSGVGALVVLFGLILAVVAGVLVFARPYLNAMIAGNEKKNTDIKKVAEVRKPKVENGSEKRPVVVPEKKEKPPILEVRNEPKIDEPPPVSDPPKIIDVPKKKEPPKKKAAPKVAANAFPRRALLINVSNYLLFNPLHYGTPQNNNYPGSSTAALARDMTLPPMKMPAAQVLELSDGGPNPFSTSKAVLENTIAEFVETARAQDRLLILFTGHGIEIEKEAYLVPVEGNRKDVKTLIPLAWLFDKLAKCKARQKLLILDVCRFPPARGEELPGTGPMTDDFDAKLLDPPAGVQVWSSCIKGQQSIELESGSVFMQALCKALRDGLPGIQEEGQPLPIERLLPKVNQRLKEILQPQKLEQQSRLSGTHTEEGGAPYDAGVPLPPKLVLKAATPDGAKSAPPAMIKNILDEINHLPPVRASQKPVQISSLPLFSAKALEEYQPDYKNWPELVDMAKEKDKYPLRAAVLETIQILKASEKIRMEEKLRGPVTPEIKKKFFAEQKEPGILIFQMEKALSDLKTAGEKREQENSKRWQANYDYALARLQSRLVYLYEYNNILAQVRGDNLPELEAGNTMWRVGSQNKVQISEPKVKDMAKNISKTWKRIAQEHPGTPWAILAAREDLTALGLVWRASRE